MTNISNNLKTISNLLLIVFLVFCSIACQKIKVSETSKAQESEQIKAQENEQLDVLKKFWAAAEKEDWAEASKFTTKTPEDYVLNWDPCVEKKPSSATAFPQNANTITVNEPYRSIREDTVKVNREGIEEFAKEIFSTNYKIVEFIRQKEEGKESVITLSYEYLGTPVYNKNATNEEIYKAIAENERKKREKAKTKEKSKDNLNTAVDSKKKQRIIKELDFVMYKEADGWKIFDITPDYRLTNKYFAMKLPCEVTQ